MDARRRRSSHAIPAGGVGSGAGAAGRDRKKSSVALDMREVLTYFRNYIDFISMKIGIRNFY